MERRSSMVPAGGWWVMVGALSGCLAAPEPVDTPARLQQIASGVALDVACGQDGISAQLTVTGDEPLLSHYRLVLSGADGPVHGQDIERADRTSHTLPASLLTTCAPVCGVEVVAVDSAGWVSPPLHRVDVIVDGDGDGFVSPVCGGDDCDDDAAAVNPGAVEVCNGVDDNCSGLVDDADPAIDPASATTWFVDADGDGYGDLATAASYCAPPGAGWVEQALDCDDTDAAVNPGAVEVCNGVDDNCSGLVDDADPAIAPESQSAWHVDADGDGFGRSADEPELACAAPDEVQPWSNVDTDCDDTDAAVNPDADEVCNGVDDNCSGLVDDADPAIAPESQSAWYVDADGDGFGRSADEPELACAAPDEVQPWSNVDTDCDDTDPAVNPDAVEVCDGVDNDCSGQADDMEPRPALLTQGVCEGAVQECTGAGGWVEPDYSLLPHYEPVEVSCDGRDNDCDGQPDVILSVVPDAAELVCWGAYDRFVPEVVDLGPWLEVRVYGENDSFGTDHSCALAADGEIACWGADEGGTLGVDDPDVWGRRNIRPIDATGPFSALTVSRGGGCALRSSGALVCWGAVPDPIGGVSASHVPPTELGGDWQAVTLGNRTGGTAFGCGLDGAGALWCWGEGAGNFGLGVADVDFDAVPAVLVDAGPWTGLTAGRTHVCVVDADGQASCLGDNSSSQLGHPFSGTYAPQPLTPLPAPAGRTWAQLVAFDDATCALDDVGTPWCWGDNGGGQLAVGETGWTVESPLPVELADTAPAFASITAGARAICAMDVDGARWCWGSGGYYRLGDGNQDTRTEGAALDDGPWLDLAITERHGCGVQADGALACWGLADNLAAGPGPERPRAIATDDWDQVAVGQGHLCALDGDGQGWCQGDNASGQIGVGDAGTPAPALVQVIGGMTSITAGDRFSCAVDADGGRWCWGSNFRDRLGIAGGDRQAPTAAPDGLVWDELDAGERHACGVTTDDRLWCWGANADGQLGDPTVPVSFSSSRSSPVEVGEGGWAQVATGRAHSCAIDLEGDLWCWGSDDFGQRGDGVGDAGVSGEPSPVVEPGPWRDVAAGAGHTCAIKQDDTLWCWGDQSSCQLGGAVPCDTWGALSEVPVQVPGSWEDVELSWAGAYTCAVDSLGSMACWGDNSAAQLAPGDDDAAPLRSASPALIAGSGWRGFGAGATRICAVRDQIEFQTCPQP